MSEKLVAALEEARAAEKAQALFYRALAAIAATIGDDDATERLNGLHADEQHHLSRLTVRLLELGVATRSLDHLRAPSVDLEGWEPVAREREAAEIARYEALAALAPDAPTRAMIEEILASERHHADELGGKWMRA